MKKTLIALLATTALFAGASSSFAAGVAKPTKPAAAEGTSAHEKSEGKAAQKKEAAMTAKATKKKK